MREDHHPGSDHNQAVLADDTLSNITNNPLAALESFDGRASPDLWPDQFPGLNCFRRESLCEGSVLGSSQSSCCIDPSNSTVLDREQVSTIFKLACLPVEELMQHIQELQNTAYELGIEERKEMTRGKYLNVLGVPAPRKK